MYRISKILNHNSIIAIKEGETREFLLMGKGIGFGKKVAERIEKPKDTAVYSLENTQKGDNNREHIRTLDPICLEIANGVMDVAKERFDNVDTDVLFPLADHISFAIKRLKADEPIKNPLIEDIKHMFPDEFQVALSIYPLIKKYANIEINEDEIGYVALHIHSAVTNEEISTAMLATQGAKLCIEILEEKLKRQFDTHAMSYNRFINHVRFMVIRGVKHEEIKLNMNDYMKCHVPDIYDTAVEICNKLGEILKLKFLEVEYGYFALHLQRVIEDA